MCHRKKRKKEKAHPSRPRRTVFGQLVQVGVAEVLEIFENLPGVLDGAHHNGHPRLLGNLEDPGAEGMEFPVLAGVALREGADGNLILFDHLNTFNNGFQGLPVFSLPSLSM